jgi:hypothetical protein
MKSEKKKVICMHSIIIERNNCKAGLNNKGAYLLSLVAGGNKGAYLPTVIAY